MEINSNVVGIVEVGPLSAPVVSCPVPGESSPIAVSPLTELSYYNNIGEGGREGRREGEERMYNSAKVKLSLMDQSLFHRDFSLLKQT